MRIFLTSLCIAIPVVCAADDAGQDLQPTPEQLTFVRSKVLPLLESRCFECHRDSKEIKGGLHLGSRKSMLRGGESGPAVVPGKPDESLIVEAIRYESFEMPPRSRMPAQEIDIIVRWIKEGAIWPADLESEPAAADHNEFPIEERRRSHWAWQPIQSPDLPQVAHSDWGSNAIDAFVLKKLEKANLRPAPDADRYTLLRRLYFDLIGLPPSPAQIKAFVADPGSDDAAIATVVDELLASPQFGERWGRHWLDLVRYAETLGHEFDYPLHNAWQYRDYVIRAFNQDVPYDQFLKEHVAGDLLPNPRRHPTEGYNESIIGTGFWFLCEDKHAPVDVKGEEAAKVDNQLDVFSKSFLGMTVACARCHDHKFDAISTQDYYALSGFLQSSRRHTAWLDPGQQIAKRIETLRSTSKKAATLLAEADSQRLKESLVRYVLAAVDVATQPAQSLEAAAAQHACDPEQLKRFISLLQHTPNSSVSHLLSLPATLVQNANNAPARIQQWRQAAKQPANAGDTTLLSDLSNGLPADWFALGHAFEGLQVGQRPRLEWRKDGLAQNVSEGVSSATLSKELRGTLMSPEFELKHPEILVRVAGQGTRLRLVIDGYIMYEYNGLLFGGMKQNIDTDGEFRWLRISGDTHRYQGHRMHIEFLDEGNGWFNVSEVRFANTRGAAPPADTTIDVNLRVAEALPLDTSDVKMAVTAWAETVASNRTTASAAQLMLGPAKEAADRWTTLQQEWTAAAAGLPVPFPVIAMTEGTEEDEYVFIRGSHKNIGEPAPRRILTALRRGDENPIEQGSGRLQLANRLVADDNPLVARVAVNRIWHHLFGCGIVASTDNLGVLGQKPTHPQLLDYVATQFRENGWSVKALLRRIMLSRTYRLSSQRSSAADAADPTNSLLHRANIRRLQGEAVRDAILAVSGRLDRKQFGVPVPVHLTAFMQGRGRPGRNGPIDGEGRRSIYIAVNRNFLSPFMLAFDVPAPVSTTGNRTVSNVPAQALIMLNNEFVNQQARVWADKLLAAKPASNSELLANAWLELFNRPATDVDLEPLLAFAESEPNSQPLSVERLTEICHVLLNSKEFLFLN